MSMLELELSEEERAELLVSLAQGLSESTVTHEASSKSIALKREDNDFKGPPRPVNRDGMGRYIPKAGDKPLSQYDMPTPGPADYVPDYSVVKGKLPEYSMGEQVAQHHRKKFRTPAPNKYNTTKGMEWGRCKGISIKHKLAPSRHKDCTPGPAAYDPPRRQPEGPTFSIRNKPTSEIMPGLVSSLAKVPDRTVPGPSFRPCNDEWLQRPQTFGTKHPVKKDQAKRPGPASYTPKVDKTGPKWRMGVAIKDKDTTVTPGPAAYDQKPTVPAGARYTMGIRPKQIKSKHTTPGPDQYSVQGFDLNEPGYTLQYRWFDRKPDRTPGPAHYKLSKDPRAKSTPAFTFKTTLQRDVPREGPGPGDYDVAAPPMRKGRTIGLKMVACGDGNPGPADYQPEKSVLAKPKRAPAYSLSGWNHNRSDDNDVPSPAAYYLSFKGNNPGKSIGVRLKRQSASYGPGPAPKTVGGGFTEGDTGNKCDCGRGITVKGRHTPIKYLGLGTVAKLRKPPKGVPEPPLLG